MRSRGFAAVGVLMTLHLYRGIASIVGPFPGKGLPTGLGLAVGKLMESAPRV